jgi:hypothetical protein
VRINLKRFFLSLVLGGPVALVPLLFERFPVLWPSPPLDELVQRTLGFLSLPGPVVSVLAAGNVHTYLLAFAVTVNVLAYTIFAYALLSWLHERKALSKSA